MDDICNKESLYCRKSVPTAILFPLRCCIHSPSDFHGVLYILFETVFVQIKLFWMLESQLGVHMCSKYMHLNIKSRRNIFKRQQQTHLCTTIFSSPSHHLNIFSFPLNRPFHLFHEIPNINRNCIRLNTPDVLEYYHKHIYIVSFCM